MRIFAIWIVWGACLIDPNHGDTVTQSLPSAQKVEGESLTFSCTYETADVGYNLFWYRHHQDSRPEFILYKYSSASEGKADFAGDRFSAQLQTDRKLVSLTLSGLELSDTAVYYCAFRRTVVETSEAFQQKHQLLLCLLQRDTSAPRLLVVVSRRLRILPYSLSFSRDKYPGKLQNESGRWGFLLQMPPSARSTERKLVGFSCADDTASRPREKLSKFGRILRRRETTNSKRGSDVSSCSRQSRS
ncbi:uncharacterized protein LOC116981475 [Amblyraja radiata]|uniref:uncharacterized protein LOC116981475 n=1 Tax=Amblyraja radiata TaxID=386614 RepID=UPI00140323FF|nr:uncharacterized protein LOC116981475 [Amblyraja radiata]